MSPRDRLHAKLNDGLAAMNLSAPDSAVAQLLDYLALLERWNNAYNLTAVRDPMEMVTRHLLDSLSIVSLVSGTSLADLGSGAGLPGIPLAILAPQRQVLVVDSNGKKARFLREAARALKLANLRVAESRVEEVEGKFDCITARAFATLADMLRWGGHLLAEQGRWLALKGKLDDNELAALPTGFCIEAVHALEVPGLDAERHVVVISKAASKN